MYAVYHGPDGLTAIAGRVHGQAARFAATLARQRPGRAGARRSSTPSRSACPGAAGDAVARARAAGYNLYLGRPDTVQVACDETTTDAAAARGGRRRWPAPPSRPRPRTRRGRRPRCPRPLARTSAFLAHPVFHEHRSETAMLRYLRRLADFDIALDRSMIPLGSCTMKLNAAAEMEPITWPEFAELHPFAPPEQAAGYLELIAGLERALAEITGYDAVSLQPNAGSQGELAGLLAIRPTTASRRRAAADVCLIPESAHGTNAASAVLAGLRVVVVKCGPDGAIDLADLRGQAGHARGRGRRDHADLPVHQRRVRGDPAARCARRCTRPAARSTWTGPT